MTRIAPVQLLFNPRTLWFNAGDLDIPVEAAVVVETVRGTEYGHLAGPVFEATDEQISQLKSELRNVIRLGTEDDAAAADEAQQLSIAALPVFRELAAEEPVDMRPIAVEYLLTCDKAVFYFESEGRVDFRELVRKLAARLHIRVDMRQIGPRDEARLVGGIGHCGQELCCKRLGGEFCPVSIRMAKEQDLSLNPQKISGLCGKLMCCLRYEYEAYKDFHARSPKVGDVISTPDGDAKVVALDVPREVLTLEVDGSKKVNIALADMTGGEDGGKPNAVDAAVWAETMSGVSSGGAFEATYLTNKFTADSVLGTAKAVYHESSKDKAAAKAGVAEQAKSSRSRSDRQKNTSAGSTPGSSRSRANGIGEAGSRKGSAATPAASPASRRKRRGEPRQVDTGTATTLRQSGELANSAERTGAVRPGQKSSGLRRGAGASSAPATGQAAGQEKRSRQEAAGQVKRTAAQTKARDSRSRSTAKDQSAVAALPEQGRVQGSNASGKGVQERRQNSLQQGGQQRQKFTRHTPEEQAAYRARKQAQAQERSGAAAQDNVSGRGNASAAGAQGKHAARGTQDTSGVSKTLSTEGAAAQRAGQTPHRQPRRRVHIETAPEEKGSSDGHATE